jgi:ubiquinone/menaquinone biosynthesis C-methylase UbiE
VPHGFHHPLFARFFDRLSRAIEPEVGPHRDELLAGLTGRLVEIGAGNGVNFAHYPPSVEEVVAIEPEPYLRAKAQRAAESASVRIAVRAGVAEELDLPDSSFDAGVASLVLCSVSDQAGVLTELRRVLKPGADLRFLEHVRSSRPIKARAQLIADRTRVWPRLGGGCHCSRRTTEAINAAGFRVERTRSVDFGPAWMLTNPHVLGRAMA